jgi:glycosyltransferase involved in cell wall biosynthesis
MAGLARKAVLIIGADDCDTTRWRVLLGVLKELAREVVVVAGAPVRADRFEWSGAGVVDLDCGSGWRNPVREGMAAWRLARVLEEEGAEVVHVVGLKPAALACLAFKLAPVRHAVVHLPDLGLLASAAPGSGRAFRALALRLLAAQLSKPNSFLLVEGEGDLTDLRAHGIAPGARFAVVGGSGIDPDIYPVMPPSHSEMPVAAFVGPVASANGTRTLFRAFERVWARGVRLQLELFGERGAQDAADISSDEWARWNRHPGVRCSGPPADAREVWRRAEICVWPAQRRQGLPLALLEAAACGRALLATNLPGAAGFVRDGVEGLVVPSGDASALAAALERLARDSGLRQRMGAAARLRLLQGYTEAHVKEAFRGAYLSLVGAGRR